MTAKRVAVILVLGSILAVFIKMSLLPAVTMAIKEAHENVSARQSVLDSMHGGGPNDNHEN